MPIELHIREIKQEKRDCEVVKVSAVIESLGALAKEGAASVYVEILSKHGVRVIRPENDPVIIERVDDAGFASR